MPCRHALALLTAPPEALERHSTKKALLQGVARRGEFFDPLPLLLKRFHTKSGLTSSSALYLQVSEAYMSSEPETDSR